MESTTKGTIRKAIFGNRKTTLPAAIATIALAYGIVDNPEQAAALGAIAVAVGVNIWGLFMSRDGDK